MENRAQTEDRAEPPLDDMKGPETDNSPLILMKTQRRQIVSTFLNYVTVGWLSPVMYQGAKHILGSEELLDLQEKDKAVQVASLLVPFWEQYKTYTANPKSRRPSLFGVFTTHFGFNFFLALLLQALSVACSLTLPTFLGAIINYFSPFYPKSKLILNSGVGLSFILFGLQAATSIFKYISLHLLNDLQVSIRTLLIGAIYKRSLNLSQSASMEFNQGRILNLINVDVEKISLLMIQIATFLVAPVQLTVAIYLIGTYISYAVWGGAGTFFGIIILQVGIIGFLIAFQKGFLNAGDKRLKEIREVLYGMKIIKFRALEDFFSNRITKIRLEQLSFLKKFYFVQVYFIGLIQIAPISMPIVSFILYSTLGGEISPAIVFPALTLFSGLFQTILVIPQGLTALVVAQVSWKRIVDFLMAEEMSGLTNETSKDGLSLSIEGSWKWDKAKVAAEIISVPKPSGWKLRKDKKEGQVLNVEPEKEVEPFALQNILLKIKTGSKVGVVGPVGSGKSSLLSAIIGEMPQTAGSINRYGKLAYCNQQPWILTETVQGNIVFNQQVDEDKVNKILSTVGLDSDLKMFPDGKMTGIGEKGVNLSGGQKARVALARAMYQESDIYLLDDPISALDAQVGKLVFDQAIKKYLAPKTVILVTHQLHLVPDLDYVIVMNQGKVAEQGTYQELMARNELLTELMKSYSIDEKTEDNGVKVIETIDKHIDEEKEGIIAPEDQERGAVKSNVYWSYIMACGGVPYISILVTAALLNSGTQLITNLWLSWWANPLNPLGLDNKTYLFWYGILGVIQFAFALTLNSVFLIGGYQASKKFHKTALKRLMRTPMGFFDSQPIGRILNRMSKDIESVDQQIWIILFLATISTAGLLATCAIIIYTDHIMAAFVLPLLVLYCFMLILYQRSNREFKRYESTFRSPLYSHISETLAGLSTIKAYGSELNFIKRQQELMNENNVPTYMRLGAGVWIGIRMEVLSTFLTLALCLLGLLSETNGASIGLALTYAVGLSGLLNLLLISSSQLETEFNSVERLVVYCNDLPQEKAAILPSDPDDSKWPTVGKISFNDISLSYPSRPDIMILKNISVDIKPGEKVGVIGRTGSGKSTLMTALFRIVELQSGSITVDEKGLMCLILDISELGLSCLRSRLQIIPQEPVLFSGTIRSNLDIESKYPDTDVWNILDQIGLKDFVAALGEKLEAPVLENGSNLSVGQRQLLCLGRAILVKPKILIMDEATASVDQDADQLIQVSIRTHFAKTTVLSIAHRLNTIADFDRVLVLDNGVKIEFDAPHTLLLNPDSLFSQLTQATGASNAALIKQIAEKQFNKQ